MNDEIELLDSITENSKKHWFILKVLSACCFLVVLVNMFIRTRTTALDPDEIEHAHCGWLVFINRIPYVDFFENHPPFYWYFLSFYYKLFGENTSVFIFGRSFTMLSFIVSVCFVYLIGREMFGKLGGLLAALTFSLNRVAQIAALTMRPDSLMIVFLLSGVYFFIRYWAREFTCFQALLSGLLLGLAFSIHPRSGFTIVGLALVVIFSSLSIEGVKKIWQRKTALIIFVSFMALPILVPFLIFGFKFYYQNVYMVGLAVVSKYDPWDRLWELLTQTFALFPLAFISAGIYIYEIIKNPQANWKSKAAFYLVLANLIGLLGRATISYFQGISSSRGIITIQNVYPTIFALSLFVAGGFLWIVSKLDSKKSIAVIYLFFILGFVSMFRPAYWYFSWKGLEANFNTIEAMNKIIPLGESYVGPIATNPVFRKNATYFWPDDFENITDFYPNFRHNFIDEFEKTKPFFINEEYLSFIKFDLKHKEEVKEYIEKNYYPLDNMPGFRVRK